ncbi:MAG: hypothetical protein HOB63_10590 [Opitutae bacterium]|nr:hypothetical protein [Opitutae bacterium]MBT5908920.1 hypothetical protein [Opitutae bacterium]MBT7742790.1 hypothetical protein [Opitutae bacterium]
MYRPTNSPEIADAIYDLTQHEMEGQEKIWNKQTLIRRKALEDALATPTGTDARPNATTEWLDEWNTVLSDRSDSYIDYAGGPGEWLLEGTSYTGAPQTEIFAEGTDLERFHPDGSLYHDHQGLNVVLMAANYRLHRDWVVSHAEHRFSHCTIIVHARDLMVATKEIPNARITGHCPNSNRFILVPRPWDNDDEFGRETEIDTINQIGKWFAEKELVKAEA